MKKGQAKAGSFFQVHLRRLRDDGVAPIMPAKITTTLGLRESPEYSGCFLNAEGTHLVGTKDLIERVVAMGGEFVASREIIQLIGVCAIFEVYFYIFQKVISFHQILTKIKV